MKMTHFQLLVLFALCVSVVLAATGKKETSERVRSALWTFALFVIVGMAIAWLLYPFSH